MSLNLHRTKVALAAFDEAHEPTDPGFGSPLGEAVGIAYGHDTADRNNFDTCKDLIRPGPAQPQNMADLSFVRRMVRDFG